MSEVRSPLVSLGGAGLLLLGFDDSEQPDLHSGAEGGVPWTSVVFG